MNSQLECQDQQTAQDLRGVHESPPINEVIRNEDFYERGKNSLKSMPPVTMLIATHHKVGTVLMQNIFMQIAEKIGLNFHYCSRNSLPANLNKVDIFYDFHSKFSGINFISLVNLKGIHIIRDPRMVVVSAAFYHQRSTEPWLHVPLERFAGLTYQQKILSLASDRERFEFEMNEVEFTESAGKTIRDMHAWCRRGYSWCKDIKLEDLVTDEGLDRYHELFRHLEFKASNLINALSIAYSNSLFNPDYKSPHVRSRVVEDWRTFFDEKLTDKFKLLFGTVVEDLGYSY